MKLIDYIKEKHDGNQSEFARAMNVTPQQVTKWIKGEWIMDDNKLYSPRKSNIRLKCHVQFEHFASISRGSLVELLEEPLRSSDGKFVNEVFYSGFNRDDLINNNFPYVVLYGSKEGIAFKLSKLASMAKIDKTEIKEKYHNFFENDEAGI